MNKEIFKMEIERSKKGVPCVWEAGGGFTNTGEATIIANKKGQPKKAIYIKRRGHLANGEHALIPIAVGDYIIKAHQHRKDFNIVIKKIKRIQDNTAEVEEVAEYSKGEWNIELPAYLKAAVQTAMKKATCYHCREAHFIIVE